MEGVSEPAEQAAELLQNLTIDPQQEPVDAPDVENQPLAIQDDVGDPSDGTPDTASPASSIDGTGTPGAQDFVVDPSIFYPPSGYPQQTYYYGCYDGPIGEWDEYTRYVNVDGMEVPSPAVYGDNASVFYHPGYGYNPQMPYGSYSPAGTPIPSITADGQLYTPQQYQYPATYYQQPIHPNPPYMSSPATLPIHPNPPYMSSPATLPPGDVPISGVVDQHNYVVDMPNGNTVNGNCPRPLTVMSSQSPYGGGIIPGSVSGPSYQESRLGYNGMRLSGPWPDSPNVSENQQKPPTNGLQATGSQLPAMVPPLVAAPELVGQNVQPASQPIAQTAQQQWTPSGNGFGAGTANRVYPSNRGNPFNNNSGRLSPAFGNSGFDTRPNGRNWIAVDKSKSRGRGSGSVFNGSVNGNLDISSEQNRGPRTSRNRMVSTVAQPAKGSTDNGSSEGSCVVPSREKFNLPDFVTNYSDAKFFIIKSYSEDDIHKSIKYSVWASTPNGNKKLDAAYKEAQEKIGGCPVFLLFSVNASGQFCGIAEMLGPVDFTRNVDYWQQDKWNGRLPVNWVIVKDIPNAQFRHITLENNDNKPVTNSRDTQEVKLNQGLEMLNIFKSYDCKTSILDDFLYYEAREKAMQEKKGKQQSQQQPQQIADQSGVVIHDGCPEVAAVKAQESKSGNSAVPGKRCTDTTLQKPCDLSSVASTIVIQSSEGGHNDLGQKSTLEENFESPNQSRNADGVKELSPNS